MGGGRNWGHPSLWQFTMPTCSLDQRVNLNQRVNLKVKLPVVFVDDFAFTQADLDAWAAAHAPISDVDDPRLKRATYLAAS